MSEDLIRRSDAIDAIENTDWYHQNRNKDMVSGANSDEHQAWYKADDVYKALEAIPTIDAVPKEDYEALQDAFNRTYNALKDIEPKYGEWIFKPLFPNDESEFPMGHLECSVCGSHHSNSMPCNYCDNCGARMKGADDE